MNFLRIRKNNSCCIMSNQSAIFLEKESNFKTNLND